jgi:hypothetical protein
MSTVTYSSVLNKLNPSNDFPDSLDWRSKYVITPVNDIGHSPIVAQRVAVGKKSDMKTSIFLKMEMIF